MISRYSRPEMTAIFDGRSKLGIFLDVELAVAEAMADLGQLPKDEVATLRRRADAEREKLLNPARVEEIELVTKHDVIAFLTHVEEICGIEARHLHVGMTSSDLLDTTLAIQLARASDLMLADLEKLLTVLERRALEHKETLTIGRSHGIHAEPVTFGLKLAGYHAEFARNLQRLRLARAEIATCAVSGAVGTFANIDPRVEEMVAARFGLTPEPVSTQVIPRDRHAMFTSTLGVIASSIERLATEIRHLQRTEVREVEEYFSPGQKGSSAMPHKRNPVLSENLTGLARIIRAAVVPALENVALWHERDISHSSVERVMLPDACILVDFALFRLTSMMDKLVVYPERMRQNLDATFGLVFSQRVLLALIEADMPRQKAYELVQKNAMRAWHEGQPLLELLKADPDVTAKLNQARLEALFDMGVHTKHVGTIFDRVFRR
ncbi:adenylosuccinate lyase [Arboricoccus pini]|uniref:Adenylosuccinate lyase n=1 Tax=Arboricoccus pini TaxID=1963835 RepID=A0A212QYA9_9PROT|nr:adenylosuccinate lyase [Arboricoccus pini]SNB64692.1 adenylosuccinate lyase [Arboricoccus pini]